MRLEDGIRAHWLETFGDLPQIDPEAITGRPSREPSRPGRVLLVAVAAVVILVGGSSLLLWTRQDGNDRIVTATTAPLATTTVAPTTVPEPSPPEPAAEGPVQGLGAILEGALDGLDLFVVEAESDVASYSRLGDDVYSDYAGMAPDGWFEDRSRFKIREEVLAALLPAEELRLWSSVVWLTRFESPEDASVFMGEYATALEERPIFRSVESLAPDLGVVDAFAFMVEPSCRGCPTDYLETIVGARVASVTVFVALGKATTIDTDILNHARALAAAILTATGIDDPNLRSDIAAPPALYQRPEQLDGVLEEVRRWYDAVADGDIAGAVALESHPSAAARNLREQRLGLETGFALALGGRPEVLECQRLFRDNDRAISTTEFDIRCLVQINNPIAVALGIGPEWQNDTVRSGNATSASAKFEPSYGHDELADFAHAVDPSGFEARCQTPLPESSLAFETGSGSDSGSLDYFQQPLCGEYLATHIEAFLASRE